MRSALPAFNWAAPLIFVRAKFSPVLSAAPKNKHTINYSCCFTNERTVLKYSVGQHSAFVFL